MIRAAVIAIAALGFACTGERASEADTTQGEQTEDAHMDLHCKYARSPKRGGEENSGGPEEPDQRGQQDVKQQFRRQVEGRLRQQAGG